MIQSLLSQITASIVRPFMSATRGQTLNDFAVGVTLFLFTVLFVYAFIPQLLAPFDLSDGGGDPIRSDRTAKHLTEGVLSPEDSTNLLDGDCTEAFFRNMSHSNCPSYSPASLPSLTGNPDTDRLNVTISDGNNSIVTYNGTTLARGSVPAESENIVSSTRVVELDGNVYYLRVKLW